MKPTGLPMPLYRREFARKGLAMTSKAFTVLAGAVLLLSARHSRGAEPGPKSFESRKGTRIFEPLWEPPPATWYKAIGVRPIKQLLHEEECYGVVRVEHGFNQGHISGHYLIVTLSFKRPQLEVVSKSLKLPEDGSRGSIYGLWSRYRKSEVGELADEIRTLLKTERRSFMPGEGERRGTFTARLNRLGIGTLPSAREADYAFIPRHSFVQVVQPDGTVRWRGSISGRGGSGYAGSVWRFSACCLNRDQEGSHEFYAIDPFGMNDLRYEKLLLEIAKYSAILKVFLEEHYDRVAARRAELAKRIDSSKQEIEGKPVQKAVPDAPHATSEPQEDATTDSRTEIWQPQANAGRGWVPVALAFISGLALGATGLWFRRRRRAHRATS